MHLPGHTPGTIALLVGDLVLLVGDTIFVRGLGRPDLTGSAEELARDLFRSVHDRLRPLAPETIVAPARALVELGGDQPRRTRGHHTRGRVHRDPAQRGGNGEVRRGDRHLSLPAAPGSYDTIRLVNAGKVTPPEDEVDVLDVGRNQCAASTSLA